MDDTHTVFNRIASIYGLFYNYQKTVYARVLTAMLGKIDLAGSKTIADIGCGTGALASELLSRGFEVTGVDASIEMLKVAERKRDSDIRFVKASFLTGLPFEDKSFDLSIAAYVAHGLESGDRLKMYAEMARISRHRVIIHDYDKTRSIWISAIERLEGANYFTFINDAEEEMASCFKTVEKIGVDRHTAWYVCEPKTS